MTELPFRLTSGLRPLEGILTVPEPPGERPVVVVCHGFKGFMEWSFFPAVAALLAGRGFVVVRFNFSGAGVRPGEDRVSDLEAFRCDTFSRELEDLLVVLRALGDELATGRVDVRRIGLFGHSRGGAIALLAAAEPQWQDRVGALVTWAAISTVDRAGDEEKAQWRRDGFLTVVNQRTGQHLPIGLEMLEDIEAHREAFDLLAAAGRRRAPWLLVHGEEDATVPVAEGEALRQAAAAPVILEKIPGADHVFGSRHPFQGPHPHLIQALEATQRWLCRHSRA
jgi:uncharacterized protein